MTSGHVFKGSIKAVMSGVPSYDSSGEALSMNDQEIFPDKELHCNQARPVNGRLLMRARLSVKG